MKTCVLLLRGINVGGRGILPMKELVALLENLGARNVRTYIQSGNVVLQCTERGSSGLAGRLSRDIRAGRGFEPQVLLLDSKELERAMARNPFPDAEGDPKTLHVGFLAAAPSRPDLEKLEALKARGERFHLAGRVLYLHLPKGVGRSKLAAGAERALGVPVTLRNWRTAETLREMAAETG